jgi:predicted secreted protein
MQRSKKILLVSHCIINQNTVIEEEARALGAIPSVMEWALKNGYGIVQLPCPEFTFLGLERPPMTYEEYDNESYRAHCGKILEPIIDQLLNYQQNGYQIMGTVGIQSSPSCDPGRGVFMEEFKCLLDAKKIEIETFWHLPNTHEPVFNPDIHKSK